MKHGWSDFVILNQHLAMGENLGDSMRELKRKVAEGEIRCEKDIEQHFDAQRERDKREGVNLSPGGHRYRREEDGTTFIYVGPVSLEDARDWSNKNVIPHQRIFTDKAMWERSFGKYIDGNDSEAE